MELTEREKELVEQIANLEQDKANLVDEVKNTRTAKQEREKELDDLKKALEKEGKESDPEEMVERVLTKKAEAEAKKNLDKAKQSFRDSIKEFSEEVDTAGIVFSKFEKEMSKFNFSGLQTQEEFEQRLKEVYEFVNRGKRQPNDSVQFYKGTPPNLGTDPKTNDGVNLSSVENRLLDDMKWTKDQYLKVKAKRPHYVANLLKYRSN